MSAGLRVKPPSALARAAASAFRALAPSVRITENCRFCISAKASGGAQWACEDETWALVMVIAVQESGHVIDSPNISRSGGVGAAILGRAAVAEVVSTARRGAERVKAPAVGPRAFPRLGERGVLGVVGAAAHTA